jgi:hypothetical protein
VVLAMGLLTDLPIRQVFKHARRLRLGEESPGRSNLCMARRRLGVAPLRNLFERVVRPLGRPETPGAFYHGLRLMAIDGVVLDVPDSSANAAAFGRPSAGPRGDGAFPQVRKLSLVELGTHVEVAFVVKPCHSDERAMVAGLLRHLGPGMLLLLDRAFFGYDRWRQLEARGVKLLARVVKSMILRPVRVLADGSYLAKVYRSPSDRQKDRDGVLVRVIRYTLDDPQRVGHGEEHVLITDLLEHRAGLRRAEDPPRPAAGDQAGAAAERDARGGDPGVVRAVAGPLRDPVADVRGGRDGRPRPRRAVVHGVLSDPEVPASGVR